MPLMRFPAEQIIQKLREVEVLLSQVRNVSEAFRKGGVTDNTYSIADGKSTGPSNRPYCAHSQDHAQRENWCDLNTLVAVTTCRTVEDNEHWQTWFYISSYEPGRGGPPTLVN